LSAGALRGWAFLTVCASFAQAGFAAAEPCVSDTFDRPLPRATNVLTRRVDIPSPQFPGLWQEGIIGGYFYTLFANGEGVLQATPDEPGWAINIICDEAAKTCERVPEGLPAPADALAIVDLLERCYISPETAQDIVQPTVVASPEPIVEPVSEPTPVSEPITVADPTTAAEPTPVAEATSAPTTEPPPPSIPCGLNAIPEGAEGITVQRLLLLGGADPGPIDGFPGNRTRTAIVELLGEKAADMPIPAAIITLDQLLCESKPK
jgi:hypothetical protein